MKLLTILSIICFSTVSYVHVCAQSTISPNADEESSTEAKTCDCETSVWTCQDPDPGECAHGLVPDTRDPCACCRVCGNNEWQFCDLSTNKTQITPGVYTPYKHQHGVCGNGLVCKTNFDMNPGATPENVCFCEEDEMICGSNGKTYDNICHLREKDLETKSKTIIEVSRGRCPGAPRVVSKPTTYTNFTGGRLTLSCEIESNPDPKIEWRKEGADSCLPGDNMRYIVHTKGGTDWFEHTTYLQMYDLEADDGGFYECVATNAFGDDTSKSKVNVRPKI